MGHGGVYKVDGHGSQSRVSGEENSTFLPSRGGQEPPPIPPFSFPLGWPSL